MKKCIVILIACLIATQAFCAEIKFQIPDDKLPRIVAAMKGFFAIPLDEETGEPLFTDNQWAKECIRRYVISIVQRYETVKARETIVIQQDNGLLQ